MTRRRLAAGAAATVLVIAGARLLYDRWIFGDWWPIGPPSRIKWCGRTYTPGLRTLTHAELVAAFAFDHATPSHVLDTPSGMPVWADVMPSADQAVYHTSVCAMVIYARTGPDSYLLYGLSGGP